MAEPDVRVGAETGRTAGHHAGVNSRTKTARELTIGRKLRELRDHRNLTQQDMASRAGVPRTYISRIENARLLPGPVMLRRIADALQVEILDLLPAQRSGGANGGLQPNADAFWTLLEGHFLKLSGEEMFIVLDHVRGMVGRITTDTYVSSAMMAGR